MGRSKLLKKIKNDLVFYTVRGIIGFFRLLPRRVALAVGGTLGRIAPYVAAKECRLAVEHLTMAFGAEKSPDEIRRLARETFRMLALNFIDTARLARMSPDDIKRVCVPHNTDRLQDALARGHGILGLTSHVGCWELLGLYLGAIGIPLSAIAKKLYDSRFEAMLVESRARGGMKTISRGGNTRDIVRVLKDNNLLGILIDQDTKVKSVFVDFFGIPAATATAPAVLSLKYDTPIVPIFTYRDSLHRHHICIGEEVTVERSGDRDRDIHALTEACSAVMEKFIREHPEQWVWFHRRWKTRPETTMETKADSTIEAGHSVVS